ALGIEIAGIEQKDARPPVTRRQTLQMAEIAGEGDLALVIQPGIAIDGDAPFVLLGDNLPDRLSVQRLADVHSGNLRSEPGKNGGCGYGHEQSPITVDILPLTTVEIKSHQTSIRNLLPGAQQDVAMAQAPSQHLLP